VYVSIVSSLAGTRQLALAVAEMRAQHAIGQPDMSFSQAWEKFKQFDAASRSPHRMRGSVWVTNGARSDSCAA
jgi:hypothetical protein